MYLKRFLFLFSFLVLALPATASAQKPDLIIDSFTLTPKAGKGGDSVQVKVCTKNIGKVDVAKAFKVGIYESTNDYISKYSDTKLTEISYTTADLAPFKTGAAGDCKTVTVKAPTTTDTVRYFGAYADINSDVSEESTSNNYTDPGLPFFYISTTKPNLVITSVTPPTMIAPGAKGTIKVCYGNFGIATTTTFKLAIYHLPYESTYASNYTTARKLAEVTMTGGLAAGATGCKDIEGTIPASASPDTDAIGAWIDYENKVTGEADEDDNRASAEFEIPGPDLMIESVTITPPNAGKVGDKLSVKVCTKNIGKADVKKAFKVGVYDSSNDSIYTSSDTKLTEISYTTTDLPKFKAGAAGDCKTVQVTIPNKSEGMRYIGAYADFNKDIDETSTSNNDSDPAVPYFISSTTKPNLVITSVKPPAKVPPGTKYTTRVCYGNFGTATTTTFKLAIYHLPYESTYASNYTTARKVAEVTLSGGLAAGASGCKDIEATLDASTAAGTDAVGAWIDYEDKVSGEASESDNRMSTEFEVGKIDRPDLVIDSIKKAPMSAKAGDTIQVEVCIKNTGKGDVPSPFKLGVFHSTNTTITTIDTKLGEHAFTAADLSKFKTGAAAVCQTISAKVDASLSPGGGYLGVFVDFDTAITEDKETNNTDHKPFYILSTTKPNLVITSVTPPTAQVTPGAKVKVKVCYGNFGKATTTSFKVGLFYLSYSYSSYEVKYKYAEVTLASGLAEGATACKDMEDTFPLAAMDGTRYVGAWIDFEKKVDEADETDNQMEAKVTVAKIDRPDLEITEVSGLSASTKYNIGDEVTLKVCTTNKGKADATAFKVGIYYSTNSIISSSDHFLAAIDYPSGLAKNTTTPDCKTIKVKIPASVSAGTSNYLGAWADYEGKLVEESTSNNDKAAKFEVDTFTKPDLTVDSVKAPQTVKPGATVQVQVCIKNIGKGDVKGPFKVAIVYSTNSTISSSDSKIAESAYTAADLSKVKAGAQADCRNIAVTVDKNIDMGDGWIAGWVDYDEEVTEDKEDNNNKSFKFTVEGPDLVVDSLSGVPSSAKPGDSLSVKVCTKNIGKADVADAFKVAVFHSTNDYISTSDTKLAEHEYKTADLAKFKAGAAADCQTLSLKLPATIGVGDGWIGVLVDVESKVKETDESNNDKSAKFKVPGPDLVIEIKQAPNSAAAGATASVQLCTKNIGTVDVATPFKVILYSSTNDLITSSDSKLGEHEYKAADLPKFKAGAAADCQTLSVKIPSTYTAGLYYFGAIADYESKVTEEDESNTVTKGYYVPATGKPNLGILSLEVTPKEVLLGKKVTVKVCFGNFGDAIPAATSFKLALHYLTSSYSSYTSSNKIHEFTAYTGMAKGATKCETQQVSLPATASKGTRYIGAYVDSETKVTEASESDNKHEAPFEILEDKDGDGVPSNVDCDDNNKLAYPAYGGNKAAPEICDGKDNNCDGKTDETFTDLGKDCEVGKGECKKKGKNVCKSDKTGVTCDAKPGQPGKEVCNGKDDDCDGTIDNNADSSCQPGEVCTNGKCETKLCAKDSDCPSGRVCKAGLCLSAKTCAKDSDCVAGETCDNKVCKKKSCQKAEDCPKDSLCIDGACEAACNADSDCAGNATCKHGRCFKKCADNKECHSSLECKDGLCTAKCSTACKAGEICLDGTCVEDSCYGLGCPNGQICLNDKCVADPCAGKTCGQGEFCRNGNCIKTCYGVSCKADEKCVDGSCANDPCAGKNCPSGKVCLAGACVDDKCKGKTCGKGRYCKDGKCVDDPCAHIQCPSQDEKCIPAEGGQCVDKNPTPPPEQIEEKKEEMVPEEAAGEQPVEKAEEKPVEKAEEKPVEKAEEMTPEPDAGAEPAPEKKPRKEETAEEGGGGGCGCSLSSDSPLSGMLGLLALFFLLAIPFRRRK